MTNGDYVRPAMHIESVAPVCLNVMNRRIAIDSLGLWIHGTLSKRTSTLWSYDMEIQRHARRSQTV